MPPANLEELAGRVADALNRRDATQLDGMLHPGLEFHSAFAAAEGKADGLAWRNKVFTDPREALESVGLSD
jgi:hypothetical protein